MFDPTTRRLIATAPNLPGLDAVTLDALLTEAHIALASARLSIGTEVRDDAGGDGGRRAATLDRVRRLASTFEAYVVLGLRPDQTRAAAFVAASAHAIMARTVDRRPGRPALLSSDAIDAALSSTLLFLLAERTADAAEAATRLLARGEPRAVRRSLILSVRELARGQLDRIVNRDLSEDGISNDDAMETATDLLYRECARAIQDIAREARGDGHPADEPDPVVTRLDRVIAQASAIGSVPFADGAQKVHFAFAGPSHVATLLRRLIGGVRDAMLVRTPPPGGIDGAAWSTWVHSQAETRPFLWTNHQKAVASGYLDRGRSMVMTSPTGSGKTTLSVLKIAATLCADASVVYLAPTHALVAQVEEDLAGEVGDLDPQSLEEVEIMEIGDRLPPLSVMTPERCLALLGAARSLFDRVGLLVFDEFHLIGASEAEALAAQDGRAIDAMLALMTFVAHRPDADLLLLSAMVANGDEIAAWLTGITGRTVAVFDDPWKPTRQLRSCVIYDHEEVAAADGTALQQPTAAARKAIPARPHGLFSLVAGWHPARPETLHMAPLTHRTPPLARGTGGRLTSNRNAVAAEIALDYAEAGKRVIVFCSDAGACGSVAAKIDAALGPSAIALDEVQSALRNAILLDVGSKEAAFDPSECRAAVHHGALLPVERRLTELMFRAHGRMDVGARGLDVVAATSTIAQGLNLPCDVVILAGTDRSTPDDPDGRPRTDLRPHEILNALGRAGRAAYAATGLAIVVPANVIRVDMRGPAPWSAHARLPSHSLLSTVFSDEDACNAIDDPIERLLDRIEAGGNYDTRTQAMIRRLATVADDGRTGFDGVVRSSLGFHRRRAQNVAAADAWLAARRAMLAAAAARLEDRPVAGWQQDLAIRNGVPPHMIERLDAALASAPTTATRTSDWVAWLLDAAIHDASDLTLFVRGASLASVFGRAWTGQPDTDAAIEPVVSAIKSIVAMWCGGRTLVDMETFALQFVHRHEGAVSKPAPRSKTAMRARRFAIRILPDIGFLCSLAAQILAHPDRGDPQPDHPILPLLQRMVKAGDHDRHHAMLRVNDQEPSRVRNFQVCESLRPHFTAGTMDPIEAVQGDVNRAVIMRSFGETDLD